MDRKAHLTEALVLKDGFTIHSQQCQEKSEAARGKCDCCCETNFLLLDLRSLGAALLRADERVRKNGGEIFTRHSQYLPTSDLDNYRYISVLAKLSHALEEVRALTSNQLADPLDSDPWLHHCFEMSSKTTIYLCNDEIDDLQAVFGDVFHKQNPDDLLHPPVAPVDPQEEEVKEPPTKARLKAAAKKERELKEFGKELLQRLFVLTKPNTLVTQADIDEFFGRAKRHATATAAASAQLPKTGGNDQGGEALMQTVELPLLEGEEALSEKLALTGE